MREDETQHFVGKVAQKAIIQHADRILVCRGVGDTLWEFPGGRLHNDGTPLENLIREIQEELSLPILSITPMHVAFSTHVQTNTKRVIIVYTAQATDTKFLVDTAELAEAKWITLEELKTIPLFDDCREAAEVFLKARL